MLKLYQEISAEYQGCRHRHLGLDSFCSQDVIEMFLNVSVSDFDAT